MMVRSLHDDGFAIVEEVFCAERVAELIAWVEAQAQAEPGRGGVRNLLNFLEIRELAACDQLVGFVKPVLRSKWRVVRGILFDKSEGANWKVPWHQDVTIAVRERAEVEGFGPWSVKAGGLHVQPPADVLERMLTVRIHLDDCPAENGALRVLPGSHRCGKIPEAEVSGWVGWRDEVVCEVGTGGVLLMRPLLLHASSVATRVGHRRVIHLDFASGDLPGGLEWAV